MIDPCRNLMKYREEIMKIKLDDVMSIVMLVVFAACGVANIRLHEPPSLLVSALIIPFLLVRYYWGSERGESHLFWTAVALVEAFVAITFHHEGLNVVAYPFMASGIVTLIGSIVVYRIKRGYYPGMLSWFSTKGLTKR